MMKFHGGVNQIYCDTDDAGTSTNCGRNNIPSRFNYSEELIITGLHFDPRGPGAWASCMNIISKQIFSFNNVINAVHTYIIKMTSCHCNINFKFAL